MKLQVALVVGSTRRGSSPPSTWSRSWPSCRSARWSSTARICRCASTPRSTPASSPRAVELMPEDLPVLVLPMMPVGKSNEHLAFPGTLSLRYETLARLWFELGESVHRAGWRKLIFFNSHGGQPQVIDIVCRELRVRHGMFAVDCHVVAHDRRRTTCSAPHELPARHPWRRGRDQRDAAPASRPRRHGRRPPNFVPLSVAHRGGRRHPHARRRGRLRLAGAGPRSPRAPAATPPRPTPSAAPSWSSAPPRRWSASAARSPAYPLDRIVAEKRRCGRLRSSARCRLAPSSGSIGPETLRLRARRRRRSSRPTSTARTRRAASRSSLMRQPYGRRIASTVVLAHPAWYAAARLRRRDPGRARARRQRRASSACSPTTRRTAPRPSPGPPSFPARTGQVATYGFSYQAMTQLLALAGAAQAGSKRPDALVPAMGAWSVRDDWAYEGGAFRLAANLVWACQMAAEQARLRRRPRGLRRPGRGGAGRALVRRAAGLARGADAARSGQPLRELARRRFGDLGGDRACHRLEGRAARRAGFCSSAAGSTACWRGRSPTHAAFRARRLAARSACSSAPGFTCPGTRPSGPAISARGGSRPSMTRRSASSTSTCRARASRSRPVRLFDVGRKRWRDFDAVAQSVASSLLSVLVRARRYHRRRTARSTSAAARRAKTGSCTTPGGRRRSSGGPLGQPPGYQDRAALDDRTDVAVYTTAPLQRPLDLVRPRGGGPACAGPTGQATILHCTLSLSAAGRCERRHLTCGHLRVADPRRAGPPACADARHLRDRCRPGARLRLSVQAAAFPAFAVNPGTGARAEDDAPDRRAR